MTQHYSPMPDHNTWKLYSVRVALRRHARQIPVLQWTDPPHYTNCRQIIPPAFIPVAALTPEMAANICRERHPNLIVVNVKQS